MGEKLKMQDSNKLQFLNFQYNFGVVILIFWVICLFLPNFAFAKEVFFEIKAKRFEYSPNIIRVNKGDKVKIRLLSEDVHHGFFLDGYGVETSAHPGQEGYVEFVAKRSGRFSFRCSVTCGEFHPYMVGYLIVGPNRRFWGFTILVLISGLGILLMHLRSKGRENVQ